MWMFLWIRTSLLRESCNKTGHSIDFLYTFRRKLRSDELLKTDPRAQVLLAPPGAETTANPTRGGGRRGGRGRGNRRGGRRGGIAARMDLD